MARRNAEKWIQFMKLAMDLAPAEAVGFLRGLASGTAPEEKPAAKRCQRVATVEESMCGIRRLALLSQFKLDHPGRTDASIYSVRQDGKKLCDRRDWARWKTGRLPDASKTRQRIENYLKNNLVSPHFPH